MFQGLLTVWVVVVCLLVLPVYMARAEVVLASPSALSTLEVFPTLVGQTTINITRETFPVPDCGLGSIHASRVCEELLNLSFLNLHENENTSVVAVRNFLYFNGGKLVRFNKGNSRLVSFHFDNATYSVDPNRIFTETGIESTLRTYNPSLSDPDTKIPAALVDAVAALATAVLGIYDIESVSVVLALHNNGATYGANSYLPGGPYENDASDVFISPTRNPSDFYYVVDRSYYDYLSAPERGYNVVLQDNTTVTDDGSLSYYCGAAAVAKQYINFEAVAETGAVGAQVVVQLDMIQQIKLMLLTKGV
jgi:hypothetical protein